MTYECNVCGARNEMPEEALAREAASCTECSSTVRLRALLRTLSVELFNAELKLPDFPVIKAIRGLGMSDNQACAEVLAEKFDYRNTYYHQPPSFDSARPATAESGLYDFVLAGEVFEHVAPPVESAFKNTLDLLKPNGFLLLSVPYCLEEATREHYRDLHDYTLVDAGGHLALVNRTQGGEWQIFDKLVFHGGAGSTLELRVFTEEGLRRLLADAGCGRVVFDAAECPEFGIIHSGVCSLPVIAGNAPFCLSREAVGELAAEYAKYRNSETLFRELSAHLKTVDAELEERTRWSVALKTHSNNLQRALDGYRDSRWTHLGRAFGLGPKP